MRQGFDSIVLGHGMQGRICGLELSQQVVVIVILVELVIRRLIHNQSITDS